MYNLYICDWLAAAAAWCAARYIINTCARWIIVSGCALASTDGCEWIAGASGLCAFYVGRIVTQYPFARGCCQSTQHFITGDRLNPYIYLLLSI